MGEREKKGKGKGGGDGGGVWGGNGIPQRRSHIFQHYNMLSAVPGLRSETHSRSSAEKKVSGKNFAGTPSWSSRDVFIRRREPGVSLCRHKSTSQKRISGGGGAATAQDFILQGDYFPPGSLGTRGGDGQTDVLLGGQTGRV